MEPKAPKTTGAGGTYPRKVQVCEGVVAFRLPSCASGVAPSMGTLECRREPDQIIHEGAPGCNGRGSRMTGGAGYARMGATKKEVKDLAHPDRSDPFNLLILNKECH